MITTILLVFGTDNAGDCALETCEPGEMLAVISDMMECGAGAVRQVDSGAEARELLAHFDEYSVDVDDGVREHIGRMP